MRAARDVGAKTMRANFALVWWRLMRVARDVTPGMTISTYPINVLSRVDLLS